MVTQEFLLREEILWVAVVLHFGRDELRAGGAPRFLTVYVTPILQSLPGGSTAAHFARGLAQMLLDGNVGRTRRREEEDREAKTLSLFLHDVVSTR